MSIGASVLPRQDDTQILPGAAQASGSLCEREPILLRGFPIFITVLAALSGLSGFAQTRVSGSESGAGQIHGQVADSSRRALPGAQIVAEMLFDQNGVRVMGWSRTVFAKGPRGEFAFVSMPAGVYRVCASIAGSDLLPTCEWADQETTVSLNAGQLWSGLRLRMETGQRIHVRIDDPSGLLRPKDVPGNGKGPQKRKTAGVIVGVYWKGVFHAGQLAAEDHKGESHLITAPRNTEVRLSVRGANVEFEYTKDNKKNDLKGGNDDVERILIRDSEGPRDIKLTAKAVGK